MTEILRAEVQYLNLLKRTIEEGTDLLNARTGVVCRTIINADLTYDASTNKVPLLTTRKTPTKLPIAELLGYLRGYTSAAQFRSLGTRSWDANANENKAWLANIHRRGTDDMGVVYGAIGRNWPLIDGSLDTGFFVRGKIDLLKKVYNNLSKGIDDRGEILTFWNPGMFSLGCLRPCMHTYQFSLLGEDLYLNAFERSADEPLGLPANMVQVYVLLRLMAQITHKNPKLAFHKLVNTHIYSNQQELAEEQITRVPLEEPTLDINPDIKTLDDVLSWTTVDDFQYTYKEYHPKIDYPFSV